LKTQNGPPAMMTCRACGGTALTSFVDLGMSPLSNAMVPFAQQDKGETFYPLHAYVCEDCFLVQLGEFEPPEHIFTDDYVYFSSFSSGWLAHAKQYSADMTARFGLEQYAHIAEVASNDGYLLRWFHENGQKVTGIEPADNCAEAARKIGVETITEFFGRETARKIAKDRGQADLMAANNVLAHVPNLIDFAGGFAEMLKPEGVVTFEFPHFLNLLNLVQFDTIYHEHFSYLSLAPVMGVMEKVGLRVFDVEEWPTHGGSLRVFVCHEAAAHQKTQNVADMINRETEAGLYDKATNRDFDSKVTAVKDGLLSFLIEARNQGKRVAAYGAAAKGATLLNFCGVGPEYLPYIVDLNDTKQNRYFPGVRIPVYPVQHMLDDNPDFIIILPWNLRSEISKQLRDAGMSGKFVTAIPALEVHD